MSKGNAQKKLRIQGKSYKQSNKENDEFLRVISELPGSIYWKDKEGIYLGANEHAAKMAGLNSIEELIGKTDYDLFTKEQAYSFREADLKVINEGKEISVEELSCSPIDSKAFIQRSMKKPLRNKEGVIIGVIGNTVNINDLKETEKKLKEARIDAEKIAYKAKMQFIQDMEHDIRTPTSCIYGISDMLYKNETALKKKELLKGLAESAKELYDFLNRILNFIQEKSAQFSLTIKKFQLKAVIDRVYKLNNIIAKQKKLRFEVDYDKNIPEVLIGDELRIERILINLISNSLKFTHEGFVVVQINLAKKTKKKAIIIIRVKDTGLGIPKEKQNFIFEKFSRLNPSNQGIYKGEGLGLAIIKQYVEDLNGEVELESTLGIGSEFRIILPLQLPLLNNKQGD